MNIGAKCAIDQCHQVSKTKYEYVIFSKLSHTRNPVIRHMNEPVTRVPKIKYLGVYMYEMGKFRTIAELPDHN